MRAVIVVDRQAVEIDEGDARLLQWLWNRPAETWAFPGGTDFEPSGYLWGLMSRRLVEIRLDEKAGMRLTEFGDRVLEVWRERTREASEVW